MAQTCCAVSSFQTHTQVYPTTEVLPCVSDMLVAAEEDCIEYRAVEKMIKQFTGY